jgi:hypothetical protein
MVSAATTRVPGPSEVCWHIPRRKKLRLPSVFRRDTEFTPSSSGVAFLEIEAPTIHRALQGGNRKSCQQQRSITKRHNIQQGAYVESNVTVLHS